MPPYMFWRKAEDTILIWGLLLTWWCQILSWLGQWLWSLLLPLIFRHVYMYVCMYLFALMGTVCSRWGYMASNVWTINVRWIWKGFGSGRDLFHCSVPKFFKRELQSGHSVFRTNFDRGSFGIQVESLMELSHWTLLKDAVAIRCWSYNAALPFMSNGTSHTSDGSVTLLLTAGRYAIKTRHAVLYTCRHRRQRSHGILKALFWYMQARVRRQQLNTWSVFENTPFVWLARSLLFKTGQKIITVSSYMKSKSCTPLF